MNKSCKEIELKYRTTLTKEEFVERVNHYSSKMNPFRADLPFINKEYSDTYYYRDILVGNKFWWMRGRFEDDRVTISFKDEKKDPFCRSEVNIELSIDEEYKVSELSKLLNLDKQFTITKDAVIVIASLHDAPVELSWYKVKEFLFNEPEGSNFIEIEVLDEISSEYKLFIVKTQLELIMEDIFGLKPKDREMSSLFKLYKPRLGK